VGLELPAREAHRYGSEIEKPRRIPPTHMRSALRHKNASSTAD
jgi:hypothetical protein